MFLFAFFFFLFFFCLFLLFLLLLQFNKIESSTKLNNLSSLLFVIVCYYLLLLLLFQFDNYQYNSWKAFNLWNIINEERCRSELSHCTFILTPILIYSWSSNKRVGGLNHGHSLRCWYAFCFFLFLFSNALLLLSLIVDRSCRLFANRLFYW